MNNMVGYTDIIKDGLEDAFRELYQLNIDKEKIIINLTKKEFDGDYTVVLFPYVKEVKQNPQILGEKIGSYFVDNYDAIATFNVVKGFLNLQFSDKYWKSVLQNISKQKNYGFHPSNGKTVMVEFSSPNTNKPLHLGHIRNILLGWSCSQLLEAAGYTVVKVQVVNDRGIAVCKSMLAWQRYGEGETPASTGEKGDHFVGKYYVLFEKKFQEEYLQWQNTPEAHKIFESRNNDNLEKEAFFKKYKNQYFNEHSELGSEAKEMLIQWEAGNEDVKTLWSTMNSWVYSGFDETYKKLGVDFNKLYYESETYLLGRSTVKYGLDKGIFYKEKDGSVWIDLTEEGYDKKIVLRSDGTSVYMTQDIGTAMARYRDYQMDKMVYVVADEQDYHFQVLFEILKKLDEPYAENLFHLSYGMVDLPEGKMKSREGTVVDADDLVVEVIDEAKRSAEERGDISGENPEEQLDILRKIGLAALKFFIIKVTPKKRMTFNPKESVDMQGQTGPYIQNAYVRIKSILRRLANDQVATQYVQYALHNDEKDIIRELMEFPGIVINAAENYDPSDVANYLYNLAKSLHKFYHDFRIMGAESEEAKAFRIALITNIAGVLKTGMHLLGIEMPERM